MLQNACFLPIIYFFYPETQRRTLEEIDLIFAKGYMENISYVKAAQDMPYMTVEEISAKAIEYHINEKDDLETVGSDNASGSEKVATETL
jgi:hypothetical protein